MSVVVRATVVPLHEKADCPVAGLTHAICGQQGPGWIHAAEQVAQLAELDTLLLAELAMGLVSGGVAFQLGVQTDAQVITMARLDNGAFQIVIEEPDCCLVKRFHPCRAALLVGVVATLGATRCANGVLLVFEKVYRSFEADA